MSYFSQLIVLKNFKKAKYLHNRLNICQKCKKVEMNYDGGSDHCALLFFEYASESAAHVAKNERIHERQYDFGKAALTEMIRALMLCMPTYL